MMVEKEYEPMYPAPKISKRPLKELTKENYDIESIQVGQAYVVKIRL